MKRCIYSSLFAMLLLNLCVNITYAQDDKVYDHNSLTNPPSYPGGMAKFYEFLGSIIKYPAIASENNIQGTTSVSFIIEKDGSLSDIKTVGRKLGYGLEEEAVSAMKVSKHWNPGLLNGNPVRVNYNLPVKFALPNRPKQTVPVNTTPTAATKISKDEGDKTIYSHVSMETPPTYPGGMAKFYEALSNNITYPKAAIENKIQGTVNVSFIIETDGSLTDVKTGDRKLGSDLDEEAVRVIKLSKRWNPGTQNGTPVRVKYNLPVKFAMKK